jgi:hypothetical protein
MSAVRPRVAAAGALAFALTAGYFAQGTYAAGTPANKVAASGSSFEVFDANIPTLLLSETVRINNPTDLILGVSAECAIITQVTNSANGQTERAFGQVKINVTIDGRAVPVAANDKDGGRVVFCERAQEQQWTDTAAPNNDDGGDKLRQYLSTRTANSFNWMALNVGENYPGINGDSNLHKIQVWAYWDMEGPGLGTTANAVAEAAVGNRTLVLEPVKAAVGETVTEMG